MQISFLRVIPTVTGVRNSSKVSHIPSGHVFINDYMAYSCCNSISHSFLQIHWHIFWHLIWHLYIEMFSGIHSDILYGSLRHTTWNLFSDTSLTFFLTTTRNCFQFFWLSAKWWSTCCVIRFVKDVQIGWLDGTWEKWKGKMRGNTW